MGLPVLSTRCPRTRPASSNIRCIQHVAFIQPWKSAQERFKQRTAAAARELFQCMCSCRTCVQQQQQQLHAMPCANTRCHPLLLWRMPPTLVLLGPACLTLQAYPLLLLPVAVHSSAACLCCLPCCCCCALLLLPQLLLTSAQFSCCYCAPYVPSMAMQRHAHPQAENHCHYAAAAAAASF